MNRKEINECYAKQRKCPAKFLSMIFTNLFPNLDKPLFFKDVQNNNMFEQIEEPLPDGYTTNVLSFYPQIHFWFLRLISNPRAHTIGIIMSEPVDLKVNPINLLDLISEKAKDHIKIKGKDELPYWMQVTNYISNAPLNWYRIDRPYYLKLFRVLYKYRRFPISIIKNRILNLRIEQIEVETSFDENSKLTNIAIFDRIFPGSTENDHYDLTVQIFDEIEKFRKLLGYKEMRTATEDIFIRLKFFLGNLFDAYCAYALNYINARGVYVHKSGHEISVVRSLEKKKWYHVSNTCIAPIENIEDILYAYRDNELWKYQLSKIGNHDHYVNLWEIARGVRS
ncbi:hypothetical protein SNEBB_004859 [Seison nebaliae]|nr:hypothetical protein SNEBB_004859 [Seison nebaliae]